MKPSLAAPAAILATAMLLAKPAAACEFDGMPGFMGHGFRSWMTDEEAAMVRKEAMEEARKAFLAKHGFTPDAPPPPEAAVAKAPGQPVDPPKTSLH